MEMKYTVAAILITIMLLISGVVYQEMTESDMHKNAIKLEEP